MIEIDGSYGEGGGQIVRTALALSILTQKPFSVTNIRSGRKKGGLKAQHLTAIEALQKLCPGAKSEGTSIGSSEIKFWPAPLQERELSIDIGTAGSITLLMQALWIPCFFAKHPIKLTITGGTNVSWSMPMEYLQNVFLPSVKQFCKEVKVKIMKRGYYPKGEGVVEIRIKPLYSAEDALERKLPAIKKETLPKYLMKIEGVLHASKELEGTAQLESAKAKEILKELNAQVSIREEYSETLSPGKSMTLWAVFSPEKDDIEPKTVAIIGADALGEYAGRDAASNLIEEIRLQAPVDRHLSDNLIPFIALSQGSRIRISELTKHCMTNIYVVEKFLGECITVDGKIIGSRALLQS